VSDPSLSFFARVGLGFRLMFDGALAARLSAAQEAPRLPEPSAAPGAAPDVAPPGVARVGAPSHDAALQLLGLLQREGRLVDFLQQDINAFPDADVGAAARVVHEGCRRALRAHASVVSVRAEAEGSTVSVSEPDLAQVKLVGNVSGSAPYRGVLRHRGWRIESFKLPTRVGDQDLALVAPAEVEL
jgi:hypothetical protein